MVELAVVVTMTMMIMTGMMMMMTMTTKEGETERKLIESSGKLLKGHMSNWRKFVRADSL